MSDRVANAEIEDVLLSIRRLVQGDKELAPDSSADPTAVVEDPVLVEDVDMNKDFPAVSALVLTPALRISEATSEDIAPEDVGESPDESDPDDAVIWQVDAESDRDASPQDYRDTFEAESEPELGGADRPSEADEMPAAYMDVGGDTPFEVEVEVEVEVETEADVETEDDGTEADALPSFVRAVTRDAVDAKIEQMDLTDPDFDPTLRLVPLESENNDLAPHVGNAPRAGFRFGADLDADLEPMRTPEVPLKRDDVDASAEETKPLAESLPASFGSQIREAFSGSQQSDASSGEVTSWADETCEDTPALDEKTTMQDVADDLAGSVSAADDAAQLENLFMSGGSPLDEQALRDMVADLVHRELQGDLGERITRNVRKLVRREIHRALASRDFD